MNWKILGKIKSKNLIEKQTKIINILFKNRGLKTTKQQAEFLNPKDPCLLTSEEVGISPIQLKKAVVRIKKAIKNKEKVIVYGDYDTDGVCATAIMWEALNKLGVKVMPFIPKREEGYGLKIDRIDQLASEGVKLIITVDQGIVHGQQVDHARESGLDVIITDHHQPGEKKPNASAIVHTTKLAGVGVSWFFANELFKNFLSKDAAASQIRKKLDLAAIGTVTDMVPLLGVNRSIVKFGLDALTKTKRFGLQALFDFAALDKEKIDTYEVGYIIGPRLNAAGRMDDPMESLRLVCTINENRAIALAQKIDQNNRERQSLMGQITVHARNLWLKQDGKSALIFVYDQSYEYGVIGLAAGKLKEEFYRPAIVLAPRRDHWVASGRSIEEFSMVEAIRQLADIIEDHGGHHLAAGFSIKPENLEEAKRRLIEAAEKAIGKKELTPTLTVDTELDLSDLNLSLYQKLAQFAPFGMGNPQPVLASRKVKILEARTVGREKKHLSLKLQSPDSKLTAKAIGFGMGNHYSQLSSAKPVDIAYNLILNEWNGEKSLQLKLKDIKIQTPSDSLRDYC